MHMHLTVYTSALQVRIEAQVQRFLDTLYSGARPTDDQVWFGRPELPLLATHVRAQDSTHRTDVMSLGTKSRRRLEGAVGRCAARRIRSLIEQQCEHEEQCANSTTVAVVVASDHAGIRRQVLSTLREIPGVIAGAYSASFGRKGGERGAPVSEQHLHERHARALGVGKRAFSGDAASRDTIGGLMAAAIDLVLLSRADAIIMAGNRGFSSFRCPPSR